MKFNILFLILCMPFIIFSQDIEGKWKTTDTNGVEKCVVEIYIENNKIYAKILQLLPPNDSIDTCESCTDENQNKPLVGMIIIDGLSENGDEWNSGKILNIFNGKQYKCYLKLESENRLKVRSYIGFSLFGKSEYWKRI